MTHNNHCRITAITMRVDKRPPGCAIRLPAENPADDRLFQWVKVSSDGKFMRAELVR